MRKLHSCWLVNKTNRLQPSIMKRRKYNRLYTTCHSRHATMLDDKMFQRFYIHREIVRSRLGIYNCVWRRWMMGKLL
jgi:hypothetical protein